MTPSEARAVALTKFETDWANRTPIDHDDDNKPTPNAPFVRITMQHAGSIPLCWGSVIEWQRFGNIHIQVFTPGGRGTAESDVLVQAAVRSLEGRTLGAGQALRLKAASITDVARDETNIGVRQTSIVIPFEYEDSHV